MHEEENPEAARRMLEQSESGRGATPHFYPTPLASPKLGTVPEEAEPSETWPQVIYIFDDGTVNCRREKWNINPPFDTALMARAFAVLRVTPKGVSTGPSIEVLKCRMNDIRPLFESAVAAHLSEPGKEREMLSALLENVDDEPDGCGK